jgi:hypothetical protein
MHLVFRRIAEECAYGDVEEFCVGNEFGCLDPSSPQFMVFDIERRQADALSHGVAAEATLDAQPLQVLAYHEVEFFQSD